MCGECAGGEAAAVGASLQGLVRQRSQYRGLSAASAKNADSGRDDGLCRPARMAPNNSAAREVPGRLPSARGGELDEGGVVGGVFVEVVGGFVGGLGAGGVPDEEPCCCRCHATEEPNELFHACFPSVSIMTEKRKVVGAHVRKGLTQVHRWKARVRIGKRGSASLDDSVMVGPGGFETVGELLYGLDAGAVPDEKADECCCQTAYQPDDVFHACPFGSRSTDRSRREGLDAGDGDGVG